MKQPTYEIGLPSADEVSSMRGVVGQALHISPAEIERWLNTLGSENLRVVRHDERVVAGLGLIPMGQWFGGASVPAVGVTAVGVAPEYRGQGVGKQLMQHVTRELYAKKMPLSVLYPATTRFYEAVGFGRAGQRIIYEILLDHVQPVGASANDYRLQPLALDNQDSRSELERLYTERARRSTGLLERPAWMWEHILEAPKESQVHKLGYLIIGPDDRAAGYVVYQQDKRNDPVEIVDAVVSSAGATQRLVDFFAGFRSVTDRLNWNGGAFDPLQYLAGEPMYRGWFPRVTPLTCFTWMLRIVHLPTALTARAYVSGLRAELHLAVTDELLPDNNGRFVLQVEDGRAIVTPGGEGRLRLGIRELATIYSGFCSPLELCSVGAISGSEHDLRMAGLIFAGPSPWLADLF